jgi:hypothetical protein
MANKDRAAGALAPLQMELREAMGRWGCPLCRLSIKAEHAFIASLSYERVLDLNTRDALKASRGLCEPHTRYWQNLQGSALGIAIVSRISVLDLLRDTEEGKVRPASLFHRRDHAGELAAQLENHGPCPACEIGAGTVQRFGSLLLQDIKEEAVQRGLLASGGLCLPHLRTTLTLRGAERGVDALMRVQRQAWTQLMGELEEFIRKNDYRFTHEPMSDAEATSWTRVLDVLQGLNDKTLQGADPRRSGQEGG